MRRASEAVNIVKCLLIGNHTVLVEAGYIRITVVPLPGDRYTYTRSTIFGRLKSLLI